MTDQFAYPDGRSVAVIAGSKFAPRREADQGDGTVAEVVEVVQGKPGTVAWPVSSVPATPSTILAQASAAQTGSGVTATLTTSGVAALEIDISVTVITGGVSPSITFDYEQEGADGVWYTIWTGAALTAAGTQRTTIAPNATTSAVVATSGRLRWTFGGGTAPTSVTFSASIVGR